MSLGVFEGDVRAVGAADLDVAGAVAAPACQSTHQPQPGTESWCRVVVNRSLTGQVVWPECDAEHKLLGRCFKPAAFPARLLHDHI